MKSEHWMQIIVGGIILTSIGFLGVNVFDMKGVLSSVKTKVDATDNRVARIADTLPEVKVRVAWEEINHAIEGFVAVSNPEKQNDKKWATTAAVYSRDSGKISTYTVTLDKAHKNYASYVIAGKLKAESPYDSSFLELLAYSEELKQPVMLPASIDANTSFVFRSADANEMDKFIRSLSESDPKIKKVGRIRNWKELTEKLETVISETKEPNKTN